MEDKKRFCIGMTRCYFCNEPDQILMSRHFGRDKVIEEADGKVIDMTPCQKCKGYMEQGIILITIDNKRSDSEWYKRPEGDAGRNWIPNPHRTGGWFVVTDDFIERLFSSTLPELCNDILRRRWMFIEHEAAEKIGLFEAQPA